MTAPDPRLGEISARLGAATPGPWRAERHDLTQWVFSEYHQLEAKLGYVGNHPEADAEFIANAPADVAYLLSLLQARDEALEAVRAVHKDAHRDVEPWARGHKWTGHHCTHDGQHWPCETIAAVAAATGGGDRG